MINPDPMGWFITFTIIMGALAVGMLIAQVFMFFDTRFLNQKTGFFSKGEKDETHSS